jgi:hypothetical protein
MLTTFKNVFRFVREATARLAVADAPTPKERITPPPDTNLFDRPEPLWIGPTTELYQDETGVWLSRPRLKRNDPYRELTRWGPETGRWGGHPIHQWIETGAGRFYRSLDAAPDATAPDGWVIDGLPIVYRSAAGDAHTMTWMRQCRLDPHYNPFPGGVRDLDTALNDKARMRAEARAAIEWGAMAFFGPHMTVHTVLARRWRLGRTASRVLWDGLLVVLLPIAAVCFLAASLKAIVMMSVDSAAEYWHETRERVEAQHGAWLTRHRSDAKSE